MQGDLARQNPSEVRIPHSWRLLQPVPETRSTADTLKGASRRAEGAQGGRGPKGPDRRCGLQGRWPRARAGRKPPRSEARGFQAQAADHGICV